jgi:hypothetical protein
MLDSEVIFMPEPKELDDDLISSRELGVALIKALPGLSGAKFSSEEEADAFAVKVVRVVRESNGKSRAFKSSKF